MFKSFLRVPMANHPPSEDLTHGKEGLCILAYWHRDLFYAVKMETLNTIFFLN